MTATIDAVIARAEALLDSGDGAAARSSLEAAVAAEAARGGDADPVRACLAKVLVDLSDLDAARRCLDACRPATRDGAPRALLARAGALRSEGRTAEAADTYRAAVDASRAAGSTALALTATVQIAAIEVQAGDSAAAVERLRAVLREAAAPELRRPRLQALLALATAFVFWGARADAATFARDGLALARELGIPRYEGVALRALSVLHSMAGEHDAARERADEAVAAAERSGDPLLVAQTRHRLSEARAAAGDLAGAIAGYVQCIDFARGSGETVFLCISLGGLGEVLLDKGDVDGAELRAREAAEVAASIGDSNALRQSHELLARIAERRGDFARALECERARAAVERDMRNRQSSERLDRLRAQLDAERRTTAEARATEHALREALAEVRRLEARLAAENQYLREELGAVGGFDDIVGRSAPLRRVLHQVAQVAPTEASVLILGETGVGKELIARAIHARSPRAERALVTVNCAALPATLVESELFGHEKGAFTGALRRKFGRFELADGGTIFLDEIGELPLDLQAKLLRVLQEGEFERLGESVTRRTNVRVVAATNRDLLAASREGRFRADLYYRLAVFTLDVPPLRARRDDIPALVAHFAMRYQAQLGRRIDRIPDETLRALAAYDWPGNIRELANVVQRAVILSPGDALVLDGVFDVPGAAHAAAPAGPVATDGGASPAAPAPAPLPSPADDTLDAAERAQILRILDACGGRIKGPGNAAERLGVPPSTLRSRMAKLGIARG